jgi:hypothetical protein
LQTRRKNGGCQWRAVIVVGGTLTRRGRPKGAANIAPPCEAREWVEHKLIDPASSATVKRWNVRCTGKDAKRRTHRATLKMHPDWYKRRPVCKICKSRLLVDWHRMAFGCNYRDVTCRCGGVHHPHRKGCLYCDHYTGDNAQHFLRGEDATPENIAIAQKMIDDRPPF